MLDQGIEEKEEKEKKEEKEGDEEEEKNEEKKKGKKKKREEELVWLAPPTSSLLLYTKDILCYLHNFIHTTAHLDMFSRCHWLQLQLNPATNLSNTASSSVNMTPLFVNIAPLTIQ